jgi:hypothetical protein
MVVSASVSSETTTNVVNGRVRFDIHGQSVLSHPFALLLSFVLNGTNINDLMAMLLSNERQKTFISDEKNLLKQLQDRMNYTTNDTTISITREVTEMIQQSVSNEQNTTMPLIMDSFVDKLTTCQGLRKLPFEVIGPKQVRSVVVAHKNRTYEEASGYIRVLAKQRISTDANQAYTPLMIMDIRMQHDEWWKGVDHASQCLEMMLDPTEGSLICFDIPLLMAVTTIDRVDGTIRMALFFCWPTKKPNDTNDFQMTLVWHSKGSYDLFGRLFKDVSIFQQLIQNFKEKQFVDLIKYKYFSSNCCKVDDKVCADDVS